MVACLDGDYLVIGASDVEVSHFSTGSGFGFAVPMKVGPGELLDGREERGEIVVGVRLTEKVCHAGRVSGEVGDRETEAESDMGFELADASPIEGVVAGVVGSRCDFVDLKGAVVEFEEFDTEESIALDGFDGGDGGLGSVSVGGEDEIADVVGLDGFYGRKAEGLGSGAADHHGDFAFEGDELFDHPSALDPEGAVGFKFLERFGVAGAFAIVATETGFEDAGEADDLDCGLGVLRVEFDGFGGRGPMLSIRLALG